MYSHLYSISMTKKHTRPPVKKNILIHIQEFLCIGLFFLKFFSVDKKNAFYQLLILQYDAKIR